MKESNSYHISKEHHDLTDRFVGEIAARFVKEGLPVLTKDENECLWWTIAGRLYYSGIKEAERYSAAVTREPILSKSEIQASILKGDYYASSVE